MYQHDGSYGVNIRVVYFDKGTGSWKLNYDSTSGIKTAYTLTKANSGQWKEKIVTLTDAYFGNRGINSSDIMLVNTDSENDIFHLIEVTRTEGYRKGYYGF